MRIWKWGRDLYTDRGMYAVTDGERAVLSTLAEPPQWPSLEASPVALAAVRCAALPYMHALLAHESLPRGQQMQALSRIEACLQSTRVAV